MPAVRNFLAGKTGDDFFDAGPESELSSDLAALTEKIKALDKFITQDARFGKLSQLPEVSSSAPACGHGEFEGSAFGKDCLLQHHKVNVHVASHRV